MGRLYQKVIIYDNYHSVGILSLGIVENRKLVILIEK